MKLVFLAFVVVFVFALVLADGAMDGYKAGSGRSCLKRNKVELGKSLKLAKKEERRK